MTNDPIDINLKAAEATVALQVLAGLVRPEFNANNDITFRTVTKEEWEASQATTPSHTPKLIPVEPSVRRDGSTPFVWVFTCPPPYNGVEIVCVPDGTTDIGIRCTGSRPNMSREREKFQVVFSPPDSHVILMNKQQHQAYREYIENLERER